jgi:hypothetical protein
MKKNLFWSALLLFVNFNIANAAVLNVDADDGTACLASGTMMTADGGCRATPSKYEMTIYEMGVCTNDPFANGTNVTMNKTSCSIVFINPNGFTNDYAASIGSNVEMKGTSTKPKNGIYKYPYVVLSTRFVIEGKFTNGSTTYYSNGQAVTTSAGSASELTDDLLNFGDSTCRSGYLNATVDVGTISAFLTNDGLTRADEADYTNPDCTGVTRIVGMMNLNAPFTISDKTVSFQYSFVLTDFGIQFFDDSGSDSVPDAFGSGPFSGKFTVIDSE